MKGFVKKDLLLLKNTSNILIMALVLFIVCTIEADGMEAFVLPFMTMMFCSSTFSYDEYNKWDAYAITFPKGRKNVVKAKYATTILLVIASSIFTFILSYFVMLARGMVEISTIGESTLIGASTGILIISIIYPLILKFGLEKARIGIVLGSFGLSALVAFIIKIVKLPREFIDVIENATSLSLVILALFVFAISYCISKKIYSKKEF